MLVYMTKWRTLRQNANGIIIGGTIPYTTGGNGTPTKIYVTNMLVSNSSVTKGAYVVIGNGTNEVLNANINIAIGDYQGKIIKKSVNNVTIPITGSGDGYQIPFRHHVYLHRNKTYFLLVQITTNNTNLNIYTSDNLSLTCRYPLSKSFTGDLKTLKHFDPPTNFTPNTDLIGNLY